MMLWCAAPLAGHSWAHGFRNQGVAFWRRGHDGLTAKDTHLHCACCFFSTYLLSLHALPLSRVSGRAGAPQASPASSPCWSSAQSRRSQGSPSTPATFLRRQGVDRQLVILLLLCRLADKAHIASWLERKLRAVSLVGVLLSNDAKHSTHPGRSAQCTHQFSIWRQWFVSQNCLARAHFVCPHSIVRIPGQTLSVLLLSALQFLELMRHVFL